MDRKLRGAWLSCVLLALCACSGGGDDPAPAEGEQEGEAELGMLELVGAALEGGWHRRTGREMRDEELLAEIVAYAEDPELAGRTADDAAIRAAEARLGLDLPDELERVLRTPGAVGALEWHDAEHIVRADTLGDELGELLRVKGADWRERELLVEDLDGGSGTFPAGDLTGYLVLGRTILGDVLLYDASQQPKHACCVLVETPIIPGDTPTGYASLHEWLATTWALEKAIN